MLLVWVLCVGCAGGGPPCASDGPSSPAEAGMQAPGGVLDAIKPEDVLLRELAEKGFDDLRDAKTELYTENNNGCVSSFGEFDAEDLLIYQIDPGLSPGDSVIAAVTKDLQAFFLMSQVDGILYDIRDHPGYIHRGEYSRDMARQELERCLRAGTDLDPDRYNIFTDAKHLDGEGVDVYYIVLNEKDAAAWTDHAYEFYVSKDLGSIARIDYVPGLVEERQYLGPVTLDPGAAAKDFYTMGEVKEMLLRRLQAEMSPPPDGDTIVQEEVPVWKHPLYRFRVPEGEDTTGIYEISADLQYAEKSLAAKVPGTVQQLTYLKGEKAQ